MEITIKLFANHRTGRFAEAKRRFASAPRVVQIVEDLGIRDEELGLILVNGNGAPLDYPLQEGDTLSLFPLVAGG